MQHISEIIAPALVSGMRQGAICDFIEELRATTRFAPLTEKALETAGYAWDTVLAPIPVQFIESRDDNSLFAAAARAGYIEAHQVWSLWVATTGGHIYMDDQARDEAAQYSARRSQPEPVGEGRRALLHFLAERGFDGERLVALAGR